MVAEYGPQVVRYIERRRYPILAADVHDLAEEVFIVVWRRFDDAPADAVLPWMLGIARHVLNNAKRSQRRRTSHEDRVRPHDSDASAEDEIVAAESLRWALAKLRPSDREILLLHFWDGLEIVELAAALSLGSHAASVRLSRASQRFQEILDGMKKK